MMNLNQFFFSPNMRCEARGRFLNRLFSLSDELIVEPSQTQSASQGCNLLAVRPGVVVMIEGNPHTQGALEEAGIEVHTFSGREICVNGSGGPTCLTRPIYRD